MITHEKNLDLVAAKKKKTTGGTNTTKKKAQLPQKIFERAKTKSSQENAISSVRDCLIKEIFEEYKKQNLNIALTCVDIPKKVQLSAATRSDFVSIQKRVLEAIKNVKGCTRTIEVVAEFLKERGTADLQVSYNFIGYPAQEEVALLKKEVEKTGASFRWGGADSETFVLRFSVL